MVEFCDETMLAGDFFPLELDNYTSNLLNRYGAIHNIYFIWWELGLVVLFEEMVHFTWVVNFMCVVFSYYSLMYITLSFLILLICVLSLLSLLALPEICQFYCFLFQRTFCFTNFLYFSVFSFTDFYSYHYYFFPLLALGLFLLFLV